MKEIWKDIPNYKGYQVSNLGRIRTYNKISYTKRHGYRHWKNRILKQKIYKNKKGRKDSRVELWNENGHKTMLTARLIAFTFFDEDINNSKLTVNHKDGNSINNKLENLEIISLKDNINHAFDNNLNKNNKRIKIINKINGNIVIQRSMQKASEYIKKNKGYISARIKQKKYENDNYIWEII